MTELRDGNMLHTYIPTYVEMVLTIGKSNRKEANSTGPNYHSTQARVLEF